MRPYLFVFGLDIPLYGIMMVIGAAAAWFVCWALARGKKRVTDIGLIYLIAICGVFIGSVSIRPIMKIVEVAINWERYAMIPAQVLLHYIFGEIVFYGGLLGAMVAICLFCKKFNIKIAPVFDVAAPAVSLAHAFGRLGCLFGGCCYGMEVSPNHPFAIIYPPVSLSAPAGVPLLAMPIIEAVFLFVLALALIIIYLKNNKTGLCSAIYLLVYPMGRFILEFYRGDAGRGNYWLFSTSQYISFIIFLFGIVYIGMILRVKWGSGHEYSANN